MLYEMELRFLASISPKGMENTSNLLKSMVVLKDSLEIKIQQTVPFVPTDDYLKTIAEKIKQTYTHPSFNVTDCRFDSYTYFREKQEDNHE